MRSESEVVRLRRELAEWRREAEAMLVSYDVHCRQSAQLRSLLGGTLMYHRATADRRDPMHRELRKPAQIKTWLEAVERQLARIDDPRLCNSHFKGLYFCAQLRGHRGAHLDEAGFRWKNVCETKNPNQRHHGPRLCVLAKGHRRKHKDDRNHRW